LPLFLTHENRIVWGTVMFATGAVLYLVTNHLPLTAPHRLPVLWIDRVIPFVPDTVWIYNSEWIFLPVAYLRCRDMVKLNQYLYSYLTLQLACMAIFMVWPTTYPRELHPLVPATMNDWTYHAFNNLRQMDTAGNCCPSLHVAGLYLTIILYLEGPKRDFLLFLIWGTLIGISTLTTKQHYFIDIVAGLGIAALIHRAFRHHVGYRASDPK
jgi:membrane-associated phospholipid phosphatase